MFSSTGEGTYTSYEVELCKTHTNNLNHHVFNPDKHQTTYDESRKTAGYFLT